MRAGRLCRIALGRAMAATALSILVAASGCVAGAKAPAHDRETMTGAGMKGATTDFQREMNVGMARMMANMHSPGYSGNIDVDFLAMMIPHHEGAVDMARLVLQHGRDPATRMLAEEIIAGQTVEIESMQRRLTTLRQQAEASNPPGFPALGGIRGP